MTLHHLFIPCHDAFPLSDDRKGSIEMRLDAMVGGMARTPGLDELEIGPGIALGRE
jgi:hypothetical protein